MGVSKKSQPGGSLRIGSFCARLSNSDLDTRHVKIRENATMASASDIPKYHELMWPVLEALKTLGGSGTNQEIDDKVIEIEGLTEAQQAVIHKGGRSVIQYRLLWARSVLKRVGALENSARGVWSITEKGRSLTAQDMAEVPREYKKLLDAEKKAQVKSDPGADDGDESAWKTELLEVLRSMTADGFERLSSRLLREAGFVDLRVTGRTGDGGIDGTGMYRLSLVSFPIYFQCKKWAKGVGSKEVRDFRGAMAGRGDRGLLITTATFTAEAKKEAGRDGAPPVDLIDGDRLCDLLKEFRLGVSTITKTTEDVQLDKDFYENA